MNVKFAAMGEQYESNVISEPARVAGIGVSLSSASNKDSGARVSLSGERMVPSGRPHKDDVDSRRGPVAAAATGQVRRRILLADFQPITGYGLTQLIGLQSDLVVCGEVNQDEDLVAAVEGLKPDLLLVDLQLLGQGRRGVEVARKIVSLQPPVAILVFSRGDETLFAERVLRAGARGYIMKSESTQEVLNAIRHVLRGEVWVSRRVSSRILGAYANHKPESARPGISALSAREFEVFLSLSAGLTPEEVGRRLHISPKTVDTHRWHIKEKLGLRSLPELTRYALRWGASEGVV